MRYIENKTPWKRGDLVLNGDIDAKEPHMLCVVERMEGDQPTVSYLFPDRAGRGLYEPPLKDLHDPKRWLKAEFPHIPESWKPRLPKFSSYIDQLKDQVENGYTELWIGGWSILVKEDGTYDVADLAVVDSLEEVAAFYQGFCEGWRHYWDTKGGERPDVYTYEPASAVGSYIDGFEHGYGRAKSRHFEGVKA